MKLFTKSKTAFTALITLTTQLHRKIKFLHSTLNVQSFVLDQKRLTSNEFYIKTCWKGCFLWVFHFTLKKYSHIQPGVHFINCCALRPAFEKLFRGIERDLCRASNFNKAISMICTMHPTFMKLTTVWASYI